MMSSTGETFVPIVSSSPPPIDFGSSEEEEDDEFGNFSAAKVEEEFESPPGILNKGNRNHFFPIDVPHDKHTSGTVTTTSADASSTSDDGPADAPFSQPAAITLPGPSPPSVSNRAGDSSDRTAATDDRPGPLSNGLPHPESSHGSSDSLEFVHSGERALPGDSSEDTKSGDGSRSLVSGERMNGDGIPSSQFNSDLKYSEQGDATENSLGDFGTFSSGSVHGQHPGVPLPVDNLSVPVGVLPDTAPQETAPQETAERGDEGGDAEESESLTNEQVPAVSGPGRNDFIAPDSPLEPPKPSPPPLDSSFADEEEEGDEFGDFGAFEQQKAPNSEPGGLPEIEDSPSVTGSGTSDNRNPLSDLDDRSGSFPANSAGEDIRRDFVSKAADSAVTGNSGVVEASDTGKESVKLKLDDAHDDEGDDDEFAEFSNFRTESTDSAPPTGGGQHTNVASGDGFAAFGDFKNQGSANRNLGNSDWASFDGASGASEADDGFGDFGSFAAPDKAVKELNSGGDDDEFATFNSSRNSSQKIGGSLRVTQVLDGCFPGSSSTISIVAAQLSQSLQPLSGLINSPPELGGVTVGSGLSKALRNSPNGLGVWSVLSDMENTKAMGYQWTKSDSKKRLLTSIGLDERNILASKLGSVPKFASDLGMLQPSKPGEAPSHQEALSMHPDDATFQPQESVPKVEFDWSGSGLTNPLDANKLNLDFFATETKSSTPSSKTKPKTAPTIDPDILNLEAPSDPAPALAPSKQTSRPLEEILRNSTTSMVQQPTKREAGLSGEANRVLDGLPDLSYMLAKVLMFPIRSPASGASDGGLGGSLLD